MGCGLRERCLASKCLGEYLHAVTSSVRRPVRPGPGASAGSPVMGDLDLASVHVRGKVSAMFIPFVRTSPRTTVAGTDLAAECSRARRSRPPAPSRAWGLTWTSPCGCGGPDPGPAGDVLPAGRPHPPVRLPQARPVARPGVGRHQDDREPRSHQDPDRHQPRHRGAHHRRVDRGQPRGHGAVTSGDTESPELHSKGSRS